MKYDLLTELEGCGYLHPDSKSIIDELSPEGISLFSTLKPQRENGKIKIAIDEMGRYVTLENNCKLKIFRNGGDLKIDYYNEKTYFRLRLPVEENARYPLMVASTYTEDGAYYYATIGDKHFSGPSGFALNLSYYDPEATNAYKQSTSSDWSESVEKVAWGIYSGWLFPTPSTLTEAGILPDAELNYSAFPTKEQSCQDAIALFNAAVLDPSPGKIDFMRGLEDEIKIQNQHYK